MAGRPTKRTPEVEERIIQAVADGLPFKIAAQVGGVSEDSLANWRRDFSDFSDAIKKAEAECAQRAMKTITGNDSAWQAKAWFLERRFPEEFGLPQAIERALLKLGFRPPELAGAGEDSSSVGQP